MGYYNSSQPYDASFVGGSLNIDGTAITAFLDDTNPFSVDEVVSMVMKNDVNGDVYFEQRPALAKVKVSVIAGSDDEKALRGHYEGSLVIGDDPSSVTIKISNPRGNSYTISDAYCIAATPCFSVTPAGKISGMTYVFQAMLNKIEISK